MPDAGARTATTDEKLMRSFGRCRKLGLKYVDVEVEDRKVI